MDQKLKLYGFNNLTKSLSFNIYDVCYAKTAREQRDYIAYIDEKGNACKPFLLPQKDTGFYDRFMMSYNIPEFITGKVKVGGRVLGLKAKEDKGIDVKFAK